MRIPAHRFLLMVFVCAGCSSLSLQKESQHPMVVTAFEDAKFIRFFPERSDSPEMAVLWGEPRTGPSAMFIRLKSGRTPMHTHSSPYHLVVLQGLIKHWGADQTEGDAQSLGPGGYWFQPGKRRMPKTVCLMNVSCILSGPESMTESPRSREKRARGHPRRGADPATPRQPKAISPAASGSTVMWPPAAPIATSLKIAPLHQRVQ